MPDEDVLPQMAQIVAAGTGAERVVVWLRVDDELRPEAARTAACDVAVMPCRCAAPPVMRRPLMHRPGHAADPAPGSLPVDGQACRRCRTRT